GAERLVAETDAEHRQASGETADRLDRNAGLRGISRTRRDEQVSGLQGLDALQGDRVVAKNAHLLAHLLEILDQVVGERIIIVDHEDHSSSRVFLTASKRAAAFCRHSRCSRAGSESATMPAPACRYAFPRVKNKVRIVIAMSIFPV